MIDLLDSLLKALVFLLPVLLVCLPHVCLDVYVVLFVILSLSLLIHLLSQEHTHLFLLKTHPLGPLFFQLSLPHFFLVVILCEHLFFEPLSVGHLLENVIRHFIHKVLSTLFSAAHLTHSVLLLLIEHASVFFLGFKIIKPLLLLNIHHPFFISLVFFQHFLEVLFLLYPFIILQLSLLIHFILKTFYCFQFLRHLLLILFPLSSSFILKLEVAGEFVVHNFFFYLTLFLFFTVFQEFVVLLRHLIIKPRLIFLILLFNLLLLYLVIQLLTNQSFSFIFTRDCLLLFFEVKECIEFLNSGPFVVFIDLRVFFRQGSSFTGGCNRI